MEIIVVLKEPETRLLQIDIIVVIQIVHTDYRMAGHQKTSRQMESDKTGSAGDKDFFHLPIL